MNRLIVRVLYMLIIATLLGCNNEIKNEAQYDVKTDIRFGTRFYSICVNAKGYLYVIKGTASNFTEPLSNISHSDTSLIVKIDSIKAFYAALNKIKIKPILRTSNTTDAPRVEIYYHSQKIYDDYSMNVSFWDMFRPIMNQIPIKYNPLNTDTNPFL